MRVLGTDMGLDKILLVAVAILSFTLAYYIWRPQPPKQETMLPSHQQSDGSIILERKPDAKAKPAHKIPDKAKVERVVQVIVQTRYSSVQSNHSTAKCPPVTVDLSLVRMPDETRRVIASSPDGLILAGIDIPVEAAKVSAPKIWAAGATFNSFKSTWGAFLDRDIGPFRVGAEINQGSELTSRVDPIVKFGIRF